MKKNRVLLGIVIILIIVIQFYTINLPVQAKNVKSKGTSMYMWEVNNIDYSAYSKIADYLNINKIYAYIGTADLENKIKSDEKALFEFAKSKNITMYIVYDENYADQTENATRIKQLIDEVKNHNNNSKYKISGIAIDSEFYTFDDYSSLSQENKVQRFKDYVSAMKESYNYAKQYGIKFVPCIPVWLDKLDKDQLEELIKNGCDYVQLMNYTKNNMIVNIKDEVEFSKKYNKPIENIAEFQKPGPHEVTDEITFYNDGIEVANQKFEEIDSEYNYDLLTFSYHYYKPISELAGYIINAPNNEAEKNNPEENKEENNNEEKSNEEKNNEDDNTEKSQDKNKDKKEEKNANNILKENTENKKQELSTGDITTSTKVLPKTGLNKIEFIIVIVFVISILLGKNLNKMKDIK